ncbi:MAG: GNAT family N-acetyltransferase [Planctomycetota bacterium]
MHTPPKPTEPVDHIELTRCAFGSPMHRAIQALRERILLGPTGRTADDFEAAHPGYERESSHFGALDARQQVIACVSIRPNHPAAGDGVLNQMAVDETWQGCGLGRRIAEHATRWARDEARLSQLHCSARVTAQLFYERLGWFTEGEVYESAGLPHVRMVFRFA